MSYKHAIYIGRFQPIHEAHLESIKIALSKADHLILFIGSANRPPDLKNPWSYETRKTVTERAIREFFGEDLNPSWVDKPPVSVMSRITILPLRDYMYNDNKWVSEVYAKATNAGAETDPRSTLLVGGYKDDSSYYLKMFPYWSFEEIPMLFNWLSSVDVRTSLFTEGNVDGVDHITEGTKKFAKRWANNDDGKYVIDSYNWHLSHWLKSKDLEYPPHYITGDCLVIKSGCVLLIKRKFHPGLGLWALPGGYININERIKPGTIRELKEETRISVPVDVLEDSVDHVEVFDHPRRSLRGRIVTHVHRIDLGHGPLPAVKANDDASGAHWVPLYDALKMEDEMFEDHFDILFKLVSNY